MACVDGISHLLQLGMTESNIFSSQKMHLLCMSSLFRLSEGVVSMSGGSVAYTQCQKIDSDKKSGDFFISNKQVVLISRFSFNLYVLCRFTSFSIFFTELGCLYKLFLSHHKHLRKYLWTLGDFLNFNTYKISHNTTFCTFNVAEQNVRS